MNQTNSMEGKVIGRGEVRGGLHEGKALMRLANTYASLVAVLLETVQNSIDSMANKIVVIVDFKDRIFRSYDNGSGASKEKMEAALTSVCSTMKSQSKYGQFGIGLVSPASICSRFTFTTCPEPRRNEYTRYIFVPKDIERMSRLTYPTETIDLSFDPNGITWWRTAVVGNGLIDDHRRTQLRSEEFVEQIALRYGEAIRRRKIDISIEVRNEDGSVETAKVVAPEFSGRKLQSYHAESSDCGKVSIELYIARFDRGIRKGNINFGNTRNPSRITARQFVACTSDVLSPATAKALISGAFEGVILAESIVMNEDRTRFEDNDALFALCGIIENWMKTDGSVFLKEIEETEADNRFQRIAQTVIPFAELLLKQPQFASVLKGITIGTVGDQHFPIARRNIIGREETPALAGQKLRDEKGKSGSDSAGTGNKKPASEHKGHHPVTVSGINGKRRTDVKGNSTGLRISHTELDDFSIPFVFERDTGRLSINLRHTNWGHCSVKDAYLLKYHRAVIGTALTIETFRDKDGHIPESVTLCAHDLLSGQVFEILNGS